MPQFYHVDRLPAAMALGAAGVVYGAVLALAQTDLERLVAYSSVSHLLLLDEEGSQDSDDQTLERAEPQVGRRQHSQRILIDHWLEQNRQQHPYEIDNGKESRQTKDKTIDHPLLRALTPHVGYVYADHQRQRGNNHGQDAAPRFRHAAFIVAHQRLEEENSEHGYGADKPDNGQCLLA
jgi:hypothetical protein